MSDIPITAEILIDRDKVIAEMRAAVQGTQSIKAEPIAVPIVGRDEVTGHVDKIVRENSGKSVKIKVHAEGEGEGEGKGGHEGGLPFIVKRQILHQVGSTVSKITGFQAAGEAAHMSLHLGEEMGLMGVGIGVAVGGLALMNETMSKVQEGEKAAREEMIKYSEELTAAREKWENFGHAQVETSKAGTEAVKNQIEATKALNEARAKVAEDTNPYRSNMDKFGEAVGHEFGWNGPEHTRQIHRQQAEQAKQDRERSLLEEKWANEDYEKDKAEDHVTAVKDSSEKVEAARRDTETGSMHAGPAKEREQLRNKQQDEERENLNKHNEEVTKIHREATEKRKALDTAWERMDQHSTPEQYQQWREDSRTVERQKNQKLDDEDLRNSTAVDTTAEKHKQQQQDLAAADLQETLQLTRHKTDAIIDTEADGYAKRRDKMLEKQKEEREDAIAKGMSPDQIALLKATQGIELGGLDKQIFAEKALEGISNQRAIASATGNEAKERELDVAEATYYRDIDEQKYRAAQNKIEAKDAANAKQAKDIGETISESVTKVAHGSLAASEQAIRYKFDQEIRNAGADSDKGKALAAQEDMELQQAKRGDLLTSNSSIEATRQTIMKSMGNDLGASIEAIRYRYEGAFGVTGKGVLGGSIGEAGENTLTGIALKGQEAAEMKAVLRSAKPVFESAASSWHAMQGAGLLANGKLPGFNDDKGLKSPALDAAGKSLEDAGHKLAVSSELINEAIRNGSGVMIFQ